MGLGLGDQGSDQLAQYGSGLPGSDPSGALNYAYHDKPLGRFAFQTLTDPLNLVGTGIVPGLARGAATHLGMEGLPLLAKGLDTLSAADKLPGAVGGRALD